MSSIEEKELLAIPFIIIGLAVGLGFLGTSNTTTNDNNNNNSNPIQYSYATYLWNTINGVFNSNIVRSPTITLNNENPTLVTGLQTMDNNAVRKIPTETKILFVGDVGNNSQMLSLLKNKIAEINPDILVLGGDMKYGFTSTTEVDNWYNSFIPSTWHGKIIYSMGNHDVFATVEGGTASPGMVDRTSSTQPSSHGGMQLYLQKKLQTNYNNVELYKDRGIAIIAIPDAAYGPASGSKTSSHTSVTSGANMISVNKASMQYAFLRTVTPLVKSDKSVEWRFIVTHYPMIGYSDGSAGKDRNDLRYYLMPFLHTNSTNEEGFDLILSAHIHGWGRSSVVKYSNTGSHYMTPDTNYGAIPNNATIDFTSKSHGLMTIIEGRANNGDAPKFDYNNYTVPANFDLTTVTPRSGNGDSGNPGFVLIKIINTSTQTKAQIKAYEYDGTKWVNHDEFSIIKNRRADAKDTLYSYVIPNNSSTPFTPHTNIYIPYFNVGNAAFVANSTSANVNAISQQNITLSAWIYWNGPTPFTRITEAWNYTGGSSLDNYKHTGNDTAIIWTGDHRNSVGWSKVVNSLFLRQQSGTLYFHAQDASGATAVGAFNSTTGIVIPKNQWVHIAVTVSDGGANAGDTINYYLNGILQKTIVTTTGFRNKSTSLPVYSPYYTIIGSDSTGGRWFDGYIANVAVIPSTLTNIQVQQLYNNPNNVDSFNSIYKMYFPSGNTVDTTTFAVHNIVHKDQNATVRWYYKVAGDTATPLALNANTKWLYSDQEPIP